MRTVTFVLPDSFDQILIDSITILEQESGETLTDEQKEITDEVCHQYIGGVIHALIDSMHYHSTAKEFRLLNSTNLKES